MMDLRVSLGELNGNGRQHIVYRSGDLEYLDAVNLVDGFQREQSLRRALDALGLPVENLPALDLEVARLAAAMDIRPRSAAVVLYPLGQAGHAGGSPKVGTTRQRCNHNGLLRRSGRRRHGR